MHAGIQICAESQYPRFLHPAWLLHATSFIPRPQILNHQVPHHSDNTFLTHTESSLKIQDICGPSTDLFRNNGIDKTSYPVLCRLALYRLMLPVIYLLAFFAWKWVYRGCYERDESLNDRTWAIQGLSLCATGAGDPDKTNGGVLRIWVLGTGGKQVVAVGWWTKERQEKR